MQVSRIGTFALLVVIAGQAHADLASDRAEIEAGYQVTATGFKTKKTKPMFALMAPDFTFTEVDGSVMKRQAMEQTMTQMFSTITYTKVIPKMTSFTLKGKQATVDMTVISTCLMTSKGKRHTLDYVSKSRDTWVKLPVGWRLKHIQAIGEEMKRDGKKVEYPAPTVKKKS